MSISPLNFENFYELSDPLASRLLRLRPEGYSDWLTKNYATDLFIGKIEPDDALKLGANQGGERTDFLWSGLKPLICVSDRVVDLLTANGVRGWATYSVKIYGRKDELIPGYCGFAVTGSECRRDRHRSEIVTHQAVPGGNSFQVYKGLYFYEEDWDGSDIFLVKKYGGVVVSAKVCNLIKKAKIKNVKFTHLLDVERDVYLDKFD